MSGFKLARRPKQEPPQNQIRAESEKSDINVRTWAWMWLLERKTARRGRSGVPLICAQKEGQRFPDSQFAPHGSSQGKF
eukprot:816442-Prorocentrum_minimum.AAC.4